VILPDYAGLLPAMMLHSVTYFYLCDKPFEKKNDIFSS
jgi:hypothetical protein